MTSEIFELVEDVVAKIATNVTDGFVRNLGGFTPILFVTRNTGEAEPSAATLREEGSVLFADDKVNEEIANGIGIDVYVLTASQGVRLRVDLPSA